ncbi:MAG TPA: CDP-alcohol phosphatidyltransferase family protein [Caldimonas sp.]|nr:CDP-alcohol phosphatidyltransferase family protein [Caldimonas sp.]
MPSQEPPPHFSMIRSFHLADLFTLANAACGVAAVLSAMRFIATRSTTDLLVAAAFVPAALVFDVLDGRVARHRGTHSALGRELDSLADVISFGVAPAAIAWASGLNGGWDALLLVYFVCCGVSRLARYNVTAETLAAGSAAPPYFEGTPIPTSVVLVLILAWAAWSGRLGVDLPGGSIVLGPWTLHALALLFGASGSLMISKSLRIPKL